MSLDCLFYQTKDPIAQIFSVQWLGKVLLCGSTTNSFPSICCGRQEEVVVVVASFVTLKTDLGNLGVFFFTSSNVLSVIE